MIPEEHGDTYRSIAHEAKAETTVRGSRFKAFIKPVDTVPGSMDYLNSLRKRYHDASHHCYAFIVQNDTSLIERFGDAGEPVGSAGKPILTALQGHNLVNVICVVVRHFGGTKLGVGGLARAYADSTKAAVESCEIVTCFITDTVNLTFPYERTGAVERLIEEYGATIIQREFGEIPNVICSLRKKLMLDFLTQFRNSTRGKGSHTIVTVKP